MNYYKTMYHINEEELLKNFDGVITEEHVPYIKTLIEEEAKKSKSCEQRNYHKDQYSNPYRREIIRLETIIEFVNTGVRVERTASGLITINGKYIVSLATPRWRVKGKAKWYWYTTPTEFVKKYIQKET